MDTDSFIKKDANLLINEYIIDLHGTGVALVTPFKTDKSVDFEHMAKIIENLIDKKINYIVVLGTTAETPTLSSDECREIRRFVVKQTKGKIPLIAGIGGNCTRKVAEDLKHTDLEGYSAILSVTPYYNKPSQCGLYHHYMEIAKVSPLPLILYNVPGRTGVNLTAETTLKLARDCKNIIAIKEASGNLQQIKKIIEEKPQDFQVISGDDSLSLEMIKLGACGVISVIGNALPVQFGNMIRLCLERKFAEAESEDSKLKELYNALFEDGNPAGIKCLLNKLGMIENELRLPLVPVCETTSRKISDILSGLAD